MALKTYLSTKALSIAGISVLGLGGVGAAYITLTDNSPIRENSANTEQQDQVLLVADDSTSKGNDTKSNTLNSGSSSQPTSNQSASTASLEIKQASQNDSGDLVVQTAIKGISDGTCTLTMTKGTSSITRSAGVLYQPSFSTCKGFVVSKTEIPASGDWKLVVSLEANGSNVASDEQNININK